MQPETAARMKTAWKCRRVWPPRVCNIGPCFRSGRASPQGQTACSPSLRVSGLCGSHDQCRCTMPAQGGDRCKASGLATVTTGFGENASSGCAERPPPISAAEEGGGDAYAILAMNFEMMLACGLKCGPRQLPKSERGGGPRSRCPNARGGALDGDAGGNNCLQLKTLTHAGLRLNSGAIWAAGHSPNRRSS